jgi:hypothetical protein
MREVVGGSPNPLMLRCSPKASLEARRMLIQRAWIASKYKVIGNG